MCCTDASSLEDEINLTKSRKKKQSIKSVKKQPMKISETDYQAEKS